MNRDDRSPLALASRPARWGRLSRWASVALWAGLSACRSVGSTAAPENAGDLGDPGSREQAAGEGAGEGAGAGSALRPSVAAPSASASALWPFLAEAGPVRALAAQGQFLWAATDRGLRRWDLARGDVVSFGREEGLPGSSVSSLALEAGGDVWVTTNGGVARLPAKGKAPQRFETVLPDSAFTLVHVQVDAHTPATAGTNTGFTVFLGGARGVFRFDPRTRQVVPLWSQGPVTALGRGSSGGVCAAVAGAGVACFDESGRPTVTAAETRPLTTGVTFVGMGHERSGTAVAVGISADGRARLLLLGARGPELYEGENMPGIQAVADGPQGPLLLAGDKGVAQPYALRKVERGQVTARGSFRFIPTQHKLEAVRYVAEPLAAPSAFAGTTAVVAQDKLYFGTEQAGVIDSATMKPLPGGELAEEERGLSVVCENPERCVLATGAAEAWSWAEHKLRPLPFGTAADHVTRVEGVWRGAEGASWALAAEQGYRGFVVWRALGDLTRWEKVARFPVVLPEEDAVARFVSAAPSRNVWVGLTGRSADGQEKFRGVLEIEPATWRTWHHHPGPAGAALPLPDDVRAVWVSEIKGHPATWFCTSDGVFRFLQGALRSWGENEGFESESCAGVGEGPDHAIWASTHAGLMRFDGKRWNKHAAELWPRDRDNEPVAGFGVMATKVGARGTALMGTWVATGKGLLVAGPSKPAEIILDARRGLIDESLSALADDGEGRLWALGRAGITLVDPVSLFSTSSAPQ